VAQLLADSSTNYLTIESVAKSRIRVDQISKPAPTEAQEGVGQAEAALLMLLMRDTYVSLATSQKDLSKMRAPKDRTRVWLLEERFPTAQGWKPAEDVIQLSDLGPINTAIVSSQEAQRGSS
jgi:hypothetical protein